MLTQAVGSYCLLQVVRKVRMLLYEQWLDYKKLFVFTYFKLEQILRDDELRLGKFLLLRRFWAQIAFDLAAFLQG